MSACKWVSRAICGKTCAIPSSERDIDSVDLPFLTPVKVTSLRLKDNQKALPSSVNILYHRIPLSSAVEQSRTAHT